jgi:tetratricopeptide (TPR) repeat protein
MDEMNIDSDDNVQIRAEGDVVSAVGDGAIAAGGGITINNIQGVDPEIHAQALMEIEILKKEMQELKDSSSQKDEQIISEKVADTAARLEEMVDVEYPIDTLFILAEASMKAGKYDVAERYLLDSVKQSKHLGDEIRESWGYNGLSALELSRGNFGKAKKYSEKMVTSDPISEASKLLNMGQIECRTGNYSKGEIYFRNALQIYEIENDIQGIAFTLNSLANVAGHNQDFSSALQLLQRSKDFKLRVGDTYGACNSMVNIARIQRKLGRHEEALQIYLECLKITEHNGWIPFNSELYNNIGNIFLDIGDYEKAEYNYKKSLEMNLQIGNAVGIGLCKQNLGSLAFNKNNLDAAEELLMESKRILEEQKSEHLHGTLKGLEMIRQLRRN